MIDNSRHKSYNERSDFRDLFPCINIGGVEMKFSSKVKKCSLSPMRKFHPYAVAAQAKGRKIYHLNIGQPDIETPPQYFEAVRNFQLPVLEYAPSPGMPELVDNSQANCHPIT